MSSPLSWLAAPLLLVATTSFAVTPIGDLIRNPDTYANTTITIEGTVTTQTFSYLADAAYTLQGSDDFRVTVFAHGAAPGAGTHLSVTGKVGRKPPDEEFDFPPVIVESSRVVQ
jgi:hypothetical protein